MIKFVAGVIVTLLLVAVIGSGYVFDINRTNNFIRPVPSGSTSTAKPSDAISQDTTATASSDSFEKPADGFVNASATTTAIETALRTKTYTNLSIYMTDNMTVTLAGSECCGKLSKEKTIQQLSYLNGGSQPWNTSATNPIAAQLVEKDPTNFKDAIIGTTYNRYAVAFTLNEDYLIEKIFISPDYRLQLGE